MKSPIVSRSTHVWVAVVALAITLGCSKTPEKLYPVIGTVTVGGQPLNGGTIQFEMMEKGEATGEIYTSAGELDENGNFELSTFGKPGAPAGEHRAWVTPNLLMMPDKLGVGIRRTSPIPKDYMMPTTTELKFTVTEGDNTIDVDIPKG